MNIKVAAFTVSEKSSNIHTFNRLYIRRENLTEQENIYIKGKACVSCFCTYSLCIHVNISIFVNICKYMQLSSVAY